MEVVVTAPKLEACWFRDTDYGESAAEWRRLARALGYTAEQHCPGWQIAVQSITPTPMVSPLGVPGLVWNTQKMLHWHARAMAAEDGDRVLLIDADTMILRALDPVWDLAFDMAYTVKRSRFPFNTGVVFLRISDRVKAFIQRWRDENVRLLADANQHTPWRAKYGGINQAALGCLLETDRETIRDLQLRELACAEWNCEDSAWPSFTPSRTRIVHVKSALRRAVFRRQAMTDELAPLARIWRQMEAEATRVPQTISA